MDGIVKLLLIPIFALLWSALTSLFISYLETLADDPNKFKIRIKKLTFIIGILEVIATALIFNFYANQRINSSDKLNTMIVFVGGWLAIKILNYSRDPNEEQRGALTHSEVRYILILGTLFSVSGGTILGYLLMNL